MLHHSLRYTQLQLELLPLQCRGRLVFSDLHVSLKTLDTCCQVLRRVREEAAARDAGILFLGVWKFRRMTDHQSRQYMHKEA